jgi:hypothetical protein
MVTAWKQNCRLHNGLKKFAETEKGAAVQVERESHVDGFCDIEDVVNHEFLHQGQTVNRWCYLEVLKLPTENVRRKISQLWRNSSWFLHHYNPLAHASLLIRDFLTSTNTTVLPQRPYSPDLAPGDFFLFPKLKSTFRGRRFQMIHETELRANSKKTYQDCFQKWQRRWERCINAGVEYFAGDKAHSFAGMYEKFIKNSFETFDQTVCSNKVLS